jgi:hypothetical protein
LEELGYDPYEKNKESEVKEFLPPHLLHPGVKINKK